MTTTDISGVVVSTDSSGNRVETKTYTDASGFQVTEETTNYGKLSYSNLFSGIGSWFFIFIFSCFFGGFTFIFYWLFSKGGMVGYSLFGLLCLSSFIWSIYKLFTFDRLNIVTNIKRVKDNKTTNEVKGNLEVFIRGSFVSTMTSIIVNSIYIYFSAKNALLEMNKSTPTPVMQTSNNPQPLSGGKRKKTRRR